MPGQFVALGGRLSGAPGEEDEQRGGGTEGMGLSPVSYTHLTLPTSDLV